MKTQLGRLLLPLVLMLTVLPCLAAGPDSGLAIGEHAPAHHPAHITGPDAGTDTCPV